MANSVPMWWMRRQAPHTPCPPPAAKMPSPPSESPSQAPASAPALPPPLQTVSASLTDRLRHMDGETLLLLALLWLLYQEHAEPKLLLALAYIAL